MKHTKLVCKKSGFTIRGNVYGETTRKRPVVILSHGFLLNRSMCVKYASLLADHGYISVTYDFCGGGLGCRSGGRSRSMTVLTEKEDLLAVIDAVKALPYADPEHITLLGCSQGGLVSAMAAKELGDGIEKLILLYPALCIPDDARKGRMLFYTFDPMNIPELLGRFPMPLGGDYARTVIEMDPYEEIKGFNSPVLLLHGTADKIVDVSYARKARSVYPDCSYHEIPGGGHIFTGEPERQARELILKFMK